MDLHIKYLLQMTIYVFFPVALFYYFNRPEFQRKAIEEKKVLSLIHSLSESVSGNATHYSLSLLL